MGRQFKMRHFVVSLVGILLMPWSAVAEQDFRERVSAATVETVEDIVEDVKAEINLGRIVAAKILGRYEPATQQQLTKYVSLVGSTVAQASGRPELDFRFAVLDTAEINAYAAPGGYIFITRGAIDLMEDEAELAGVLAHEVAHVSQKHIVKELNIKGSEKGSAAAGVAHMLGGAGGSARVAFNQAIDKAIGLLFVNGLKREDELEADRVGTLLATISGYDPKALHRYLERVKQVKGKESEILSHTHPPFDARLTALDTLFVTESLGAIRPATVKERFNLNIRQ